MRPDDPRRDAIPSIVLAVGLVVVRRMAGPWCLYLLWSPCPSVDLYSRFQASERLAVEPRQICRRLARHGEPVRRHIGAATGGLVLIAMLMGACTNGDGDLGRRHQRGATTQTRGDVPPLPSISNPDGSQPDRRSWRQLWRTTPGTPEDRCIDVEDRTDVRSGAFIAGNFVSFIAGWDGTPETSKLYYIPAAPVAGQSLTVVAELLGDAAPQTVTFTFRATAWTTNGIPFYASGTVLPARGRWRLTLTAGENSGCFELAL